MSADGEAVATVTIPAATPAGAHALVAADAQGVELARGDLAVTRGGGKRQPGDHRRGGGDLGWCGSRGPARDGARSGALAAEAPPELIR